MPSPGAGRSAGNSGQRFPGTVQDTHTGRRRRKHNRPGNHQRLEKGCHRQMLRRRHFTKAKIVGEAERGKKANEDGGQCGVAPVGLSLGASDRRPRLLGRFGHAGNSEDVAVKRPASLNRPDQESKVVSGQRRLVWKIAVNLIEFFQGRLHSTRIARSPAIGIPGVYDRLEASQFPL